MALKKSYSHATNDGTPTGLEAPDAYHRVRQVVVDVEGEKVQFGVAVYKDEAARDADPEAIIVTRFFAFENSSQEDSPIGEASSFDKRAKAIARGPTGDIADTLLGVAYRWLKNHQLYQDATDV